MKKIKVISCMVTLGIMALVFFFSSQTSNESECVSGGITYEIAKIIVSIFGGSENSKFEIAKNLEFYVRKTAHFTIFASIGLSSLVTIKLLTQKPTRKAAFYALIFSMIYAASDEIHQIFVSGRTAQFIDVCIDTAGAAIGILIMLLIFHGIKKKRK